MANIEFAGQAYRAEPGETVLDCLLRCGVAISYSCKAGACQSCLVKRVAGEIPQRAQQGLKDSLRAEGYFLACSCEAAEGLSAVPAGAEQRVAAWISERERLSESVLRVRLRTEVPFAYRAGQFITLFRPDGLSRSYSLASVYSDDELELHIRLRPGGAMSQWLDGSAIGQAVQLQGPAGGCFYVSGKPEQPMLLAGTGTGLAPLFGIVRDALAQQHRGPIWLFHGAVETAGLYLVDELRALALRHENFQYVPAVLNGAPPADGVLGALDTAVLQRFPQLDDWRGFVCGDPGFVDGFRKKIFLAGVASRDIYADAFLPSSLAPPLAG